MIFGRSKAELELDAEKFAAETRFREQLLDELRQLNATLTSFGPVFGAIAGGVLTSAPLTLAGLTEQPKDEDDNHA